MDEMSDQKNRDSREWEVSSAQMRRTHGFVQNMDQTADARQEAEELKDLASDILRLARNTLLIDLRFMEAAFVNIIPGHDEDTPGIATDGRFFYYNSRHICSLYKRAKELPPRDYLHTVLHCVYRHIFVGEKIRRNLWNLACDIAVENTINDLNLKSLYAERQTQQKWFIDELKEKIPRLTAEWIYKYLDEDQDINEYDIAHLQNNFFADDHTLWYAQGEPGKPDQQDEDDDEDDDTEGEQQIPGPDDSADDQDSGEMEMEDSETRSGEGGSGDGDREGEPAYKPDPDDLEHKWRDISERIQTDLDTFSDTYGSGAGNMQQALREINREKYDYAELLRRFSVLGENIEINEDEFDYIYYTYGMKMYGKMPLIEPLEYKEVKKVRDFVIAIDTSESVAGDIVQKFVSKTWNILKQSENFFSRVNVHIIQCGARVEEDVKITTQDEFDEYMKHMVLKGFGGTDFRPVFEHVDMLLRQHEFNNFKGLIYFTDGYGTFPASVPAYDSVFVFLDQGYDLPEVPVWVIKMILREDQIMEF